MEAEIAIIGGSGVYTLSMLKGAEKVTVKTPYGRDPDVVIGELAGRKVAFISRHGKGHSVPPHLVNYRANIWALHKLGVKRIIATTATGTLNPKIVPGDLTLLTQFVDFTKVRAPTFYEGSGNGGVVHVDMTEPYCAELRGVISKAAKKMGIKLHPKSTYACMEGPRFETAAEIKALQTLGCDIVGMTNVPECVLAREIQICYATIGVITNWAAGMTKEMLSHAAVLRLMEQNIDRTRRLIIEAVEKIPEERGCNCAAALEGGRIGA